MWIKKLRFKREFTFKSSYSIPATLISHLSLSFCRSLPSTATAVVWPAIPSIAIMACPSSASVFHRPCDSRSFALFENPFHRMNGFAWLHQLQRHTHTKWRSALVCWKLTSLFPSQKYDPKPPKRGAMALYCGAFQPRHHRQLFTGRRRRRRCHTFAVKFCNMRPFGALEGGGHTISLVWQVQDFPLEVTKLTAFKVESTVG